NDEALYGEGSFDIFHHKIIPEILASAFRPLGFIANVYVLSVCYQNLSHKKRNRANLAANDVPIRPCGSKENNSKDQLARHITSVSWYSALCILDSISDIHAMIYATFITVADLALYLSIFVMYGLIINRIQNTQALISAKKDKQLFRASLISSNDKFLGIIIASVVVGTNMLFWFPSIVLNAITIFDGFILRPRKSRLFDDFGSSILLLLPCDGLINALAFIIVPIFISCKKINKKINSLT
ncbi:hypothetical protein TrispH2_011853, partial [Trichoplax sp. H2]